MITFELDQTKEGMEIYLDSADAEELIDYLRYVKKDNESMHLLVGNELQEKLINNDNSLLKHVKLIYLGE